MEYGFYVLRHWRRAARSWRRRASPRRGRRRRARCDTEISAVHRRSVARRRVMRARRPNGRRLRRAMLRPTARSFFRSRRRACTVGRVAPHAPHSAKTSHSTRRRATPSDAERAGFRPCKRCRPQGASVHDRTLTIARAACKAIDEREVAPSLAELASAGAAESRFMLPSRRRFSGRCSLQRANAACARCCSVTTKRWYAPISRDVFQTRDSSTRHMDSRHGRTRSQHTSNDRTVRSRFRSMSCRRGNDRYVYGDRRATRYAQGRARRRERVREKSGRLRDSVSSRGAARRRSRRLPLGAYAQSRSARPRARCVARTSVR